MMRNIFLIIVSCLFFISCVKNAKKDNLSAGKTVYYRIKMIDKNGHVTVSQVRTVTEK